MNRTSPTQASAATSRTGSSRPTFAEGACVIALAPRGGGSKAQKFIARVVSVEGDTAELYQFELLRHRAVHVDSLRAPTKAEIRTFDRWQEQRWGFKRYVVAAG